MPRREAKPVANAVLYLRGVPQELVREAKAVAARRGTTLKALVTEALAAALRVDGGKPRSAAADELPADFRAAMAWFEPRKRALAKRYPGEYVAIMGARVIDHDHKFDPLARRVFERLGVRPIFMPRMPRPGERDDAEVVHVPSPRVVRA